VTLKGRPGLERVGLIGVAAKRPGQARRVGGHLQINTATQEVKAPTVPTVRSPEDGARAWTLDEAPAVRALTAN